MSEAEVNAIGKEIEIMEKVDHPNIVKMASHYEDNSHYCLVMELMDGGEVSKD